ncbi:MAG TPA: 23S rRNA (guanosine(2251)-2'-O)-methyltransferase RlmB [Clostridiales bacterium]|nr:23S rRNA (guanosine(2251)-2'-O)-methyltransferase RlmB [Clostridiales bacterium]
MYDRQAHDRGTKNQIEGKNPILEALHSNRAIEKIFIAKGSQDKKISKILKKAADRDVKVEEVDRREIENMAETSAHQGIVAIVSPYRYVEISDIMELAQSLGEPPFVLILDHIKDPHNFGAIIRTAEACGVHGIIIPKRRAVDVTPIVAKASAGAVEHMLIAKVANIANTIDRLKELGLWIAGTSMEGTIYTEHDLTGPLGIVIGSEGEGMARLVKEKCDFLLSIPMKGQVESLNASVAASVIMYEAVRQRG